MPDLVGRLHDRLALRLESKAVFRDVDAIAAGSDFRDALQRALAASDVLLAIIGPRFLDCAPRQGSDYVVDEIAAALERSLPVLPVLVHDARMPSPEQLPPRIRALSFLQASRLRGDPDFSGDADKLLRELTRLVPTLLETPTLDSVTQAVPVANVRMTMHIACFVGSGTVCCFLNITNLTPHDVEVTHVWIESTPPAFPTPRERPLPKRLRPQESWETYLPVSALPAGEPSEAQLCELGRARLSSGQVIHSVRNETVPPFGSVPGGPIYEVP